MDQRVHPRCQQSRIAAEVTKGDSQREGRKKKAKEREGKKGKGYSPDTSLVRGVGVLYMGGGLSHRYATGYTKMLPDPNL